MSISQNHHDLFQDSSALDKLNLFQSLLDAGSLTSDEALALLNTIHAELERPEGHDHSVYTRYAEVMESLRVKMPKIHEGISANWQKLRSNMQAKADAEKIFEDNEPRKKNKPTENLLSKLPKRIDVNKGADNRGGKEEEGESEEKESGEGEAEEVEETAEAEEACGYWLKRMFSDRQKK